MNARLSSLPKGRKAVIEEVLGTLCSVYARELFTLVYNPRMPDGPVNTLIEWADDLGAADPSSGLDLAILRDVLPALNAAFLASYAYAPAPSQHPFLGGRKVDLVLHDQGGALLVERTRAAACLLAVAVHGEAGAALVAQADRELREAMDAISQAIARHL